MSAPRSNRYDASVDSPRRLLVRRMAVGSNQALSSAIRGGVGHFAVAAAHHAADRLRPRRVGDDEDVWHERTVLAIERRDAFACPRVRMRSSGPPSRSKSNACIGWPISSNT